MLQQRIFSRKLPKSFDSLTTNKEVGHDERNHHKNLQELKRKTLDAEIERHEKKIQGYEELYRQKLVAFEFDLSHRVDHHQKHLTNNIITCIKAYLDHRTNLSIRRIRYEESLLRTKLLRHRLNRRLKNKVTHVYPQVIIDSSTISLSSRQLDYLSTNGKLNLSLCSSTTDMKSILLDFIRVSLSSRSKLYSIESKLSLF